MMTNLHTQLKQDCIVLGKFPLSYLLLMRDANYPWFILVPDRDDISEIYQLSKDEQNQLISESSELAMVLMQAFDGDKMNIAALGNIVPQCHLHHVVRYKGDIAWPAPIWGKFPAKPYTQETLSACIEKLNKYHLKDFIYIETNENL